MVTRHYNDDPTEDECNAMASVSSEALPSHPIFQKYYPMGDWMYSPALQRIILQCLRYRSQERPSPSSLHAQIEREITQMQRSWPAPVLLPTLDYDRFNWRVGDHAPGWDAPGVRTRRNDGPLRAGLP